MQTTFEGLQELGFSPDDIRILWCRCPQIAVLDPEGRPAALIDWLQGVGLTRAEALKAIKRQPQMVGLSIDNNLAPSLQFVRDSLDLSPEGLRRVRDHGWVVGTEGVGQRSRAWCAEHVARHRCASSEIPCPPIALPRPLASLYYPTPIF